jgi:DNA-binding transcriptional ArsR family regulator
VSSPDPPGAGPEPDVDAVFAALADPTRRRLLDQLSSEGPLTATELSTSYAVSRQAVVKHLGSLTAAGLLDAERHGREVRYGVVAGRLGTASEWIAEVGSRWDQRLEALRRQLGRPQA